MDWSKIRTVDLGLLNFLFKSPAKCMIIGLRIFACWTVYVKILNLKYILMHRTHMLLGVQQILSWIYAYVALLFSKFLRLKYGNSGVRSYSCSEIFWLWCASCSEQYLWHRVYIRNIEQIKRTKGMPLVPVETIGLLKFDQNAFVFSAGWTCARDPMKPLQWEKVNTSDKKNNFGRENTIILQINVNNLCSIKDSCWTTNDRYFVKVLQDRLIYFTHLMTALTQYLF